MPKKLIRNLTKNDLQNIVDRSTSRKQVLDRLGYNVCSRAYTTLNTFFKLHDINLDKMGINHISKKTCGGITKRTRRPKLLTTLNYAGVEYKCKRCNISSWQGESITLHVDHIDGDRYNDHIDNLRFLCPNCHTQTPTHSGKNNKKSRKCKRCCCELTSYTKYCKICLPKVREETNKAVGISSRKFNPTKIEFKKCLEKNNYNMSAAGRYYGVSDNAVRKRCIKMNIEFKK